MLHETHVSDIYKFAPILMKIKTYAYHVHWYPNPFDICVKTGSDPPSSEGFLEVTVEVKVVVVRIRSELVEVT